MKLYARTKSGRGLGLDILLTGQLTESDGKIRDIEVALPAGSDYVYGVVTSKSPNGRVLLWVDAGDVCVNDGSTATQDELRAEAVRVNNARRDDMMRERAQGELAVSAKAIVELRDLSAIELPLVFSLHQQRAYATAGEGEIWRGRITLLDLDIEGFPQIDDTISLIRSTVMTRGRALESVTVSDLRQGSIGPIGPSDKSTGTAESRQLTITAKPEKAFRQLVYESNLARLQRRVIETAKEWRSTPPGSVVAVPLVGDRARAQLGATESTGPWFAALREMEQAIDNLVRWEQLP